MTFTVLIIVWACLAAVVLAFAIFRTVAGLHEDDNFHISTGEEQLIPGQLAFYGLGPSERTG